MKPRVSIREALEDPQLLGGALPGESWLLWRVLLIAAMGEALTDDERKLFESVTGRPEAPHERVDEFWNIVGRRGGKTRAAGTLGAYIAALCDWGDCLAPGERGVLPVMAASMTQAQRAFMHISGVLENSPSLCELIENTTTETISLSTSVDIEIRPANFRTVRGITSVSVISDEIAFWHIDGSKNPDGEILEAVRPSLATTGGMLIVISSPYARKGELYKTYRQNYGAEGDPLILVSKAASKVLNPTLSDKVIERAYKRDPAVAMAEYGGEFRTDVEALITPEVIEQCVDFGVRERPYSSAQRYYGFVDPSGGSADAMTLAIAHTEGDLAVLDLIREVRPPFSPEAVAKEFSLTLKSYGLNSVTGDRYGGEWPRERFKVHGISYLLSEKTRSELYLDLVPAMNSGSVRLIENSRMTDELRGLERRASRGGKDIIDHAPGQHDDIANAAAGALSLVGKPSIAAAMFLTSRHRNK